MTSRLILLLVLLAPTGCRSPKETPAPQPATAEIVRAAPANPAFRWQTRETADFRIHAAEAQGKGLDVVGHARGR